MDRLAHEPDSRVAGRGCRTRARPGSRSATVGLLGQKRGCFGARFRKSIGRFAGCRQVTDRLTPQVARSPRANPSEPGIDRRRHPANPYLAREPPRTEPGASPAARGRAGVAPAPPHPARRAARPDEPPPGRAGRAKPPLARPSVAAHLGVDRAARPVRLGVHVDSCCLWPGCSCPPR